MEAADYEVLSVREQLFHERVRECIISALLFATLYILCHIFLTRFKRPAEFTTVDDEDATVNKIALELCTFTLAVALGAVLLLPFSIISNEVLLSLPRNYYIQWLNGSLIHGLWNLVFLFSNLSLIFLMPFAYFFTESEGFAGSRKNGRPTDLPSSGSLPKGLHCLGLCRAKAGSWQLQDLTCCCCPGTLAGSEMGNRVAKTRIGVLIWGMSMVLGIAASPLNKTTAGGPYHPLACMDKAGSQFWDPQNLCFGCSVLATGKTMVARNTRLIARLPHCLLLVFHGASWTEYQRAESLV